MPVAKKQQPTMKLWPEVNEVLDQLSLLLGNKTQIANAALLMFAYAPHEERERFMVLAGNIKKGVPLPQFKQETLEQSLARIQSMIKAKSRKWE